MGEGDAEEKGVDYSRYVGADVDEKIKFAEEDRAKVGIKKESSKTQFPATKLFNVEMETIEELIGMRNFTKAKKYIDDVDSQTYDPILKNFLVVAENLIDAHQNLEKMTQEKIDRSWKAKMNDFRLELRGIS